MSIIKSYSVGNGDMFYINHGSDNFTIIDCCYDDDAEKKAIFNEISTLASKKGMRRFISTHPDDDHIKGLNEFEDTIGVWNFYCVGNSATKTDATNDFKKYCSLRDGDKHFYLYKGCSRKWMNIRDDKRGCAGINCLWPDTSNQDFKDALQEAKNGGSPNNISPIITYAIGDLKAMWMGDLETDFLDKIQDNVAFEKVNILFAPHHGRKSGKISSGILDLIDPDIIIIGEAPSEYLTYYSDYNTITQNSAGDIILDCGDGSNAKVYVSNYSYSVKFLKNESLPNTFGKYIGTLVL